MRDDINLLPKKQSTVSGQVIFVIILLVAVLVLSVGYIGVLLPNLTMNSIKNSISVQEQELKQYATVEEKYNNLLADIADAEKKNKAIDSLKTGSLLMTQLFEDIQDAIPTDITLNSMSVLDGKMSIEGTSPNLNDIAKFMVKLRMLEYVQKVGITSTNVDSEEQCTFAIDIEFVGVADEAEPTGQPTVTEAPVQEGGQ